MPDSVVPLIGTKSLTPDREREARELISKTVALDFDGTIAEYEGWRGDWHVGDPIPGAKEFVERLVGKGFNVVVYTARTHLSPIRNWLRAWGFPNLAVKRKMVAAVYVDDRAHRFDKKAPGAYETAYAAVLSATHTAK